MGGKFGHDWKAGIEIEKVDVCFGHATDFEGGIDGAGYRRAGMEVWSEPDYRMVSLASMEGRSVYSHRCLVCRLRQAHISIDLVRRRAGLRSRLR
jgi:hypothetical protein